jgi:hypothetical protein
MQRSMRPRPLLPLAALTLVAAGSGTALGAHPLKGGHYAGKTGQRRMISFDVSSDGQRVVHPIISMSTICLGGGHSWAHTSAHITAKASGRVRHGQFRLRFTEHAQVSGGARATAHFALLGHFTSRVRARGKVSVDVRYSSGADCRASGVKFRAKS